ncbi:MAG TPA: hypothetical protein VLG39_06600 [Nitrospirota bacterium]|nr:hypothetical protein [Nitrospirota bacterium]
MEVSEFFLKLLVILLAVKLFAEIFSRLSIPSVLGEVVAGLIIGPSVRLVMVQEAKEENPGNPNSRLDKQQSRESISCFPAKRSRT